MRVEGRVVHRNLMGPVAVLTLKEATGDCRRIFLSKKVVGPVLFDEVKRSGYGAEVSLTVLDTPRALPHTGTLVHDVIGA